MVDTVELGAGSYPEPEEQKCYQFDFNATISGFGTVYADNEEQARELIDSGDYDDIIDTYDMEITEIIKVEES